MIPFVLVSKWEVGTPIRLLFVRARAVMKSQRYRRSPVMTHRSGTAKAAPRGLETIRRAREKKTDVSIAYVDQTLPITDPRCRQTFLDGLRKAGLPE
jgi:hypothetical protein